jgi:hypothetical protein
MVVSIPNQPARMTPEQFCYWLHGYFEIAFMQLQAPKLDDLQVQVIRRHLDLVFSQAPQQSFALPQPFVDRVTGAGVADNMPWHKREVFVC